MFQDYLPSADYVGKHIVALAAAGLPFPTTLFYSQNSWFFALFVWRYLRLVVHIVSFWLYKPVPVLECPTVLPSDCTVIIPINDPRPDDLEFRECLRTVLANNPAAVIVTTVGMENLGLCRRICAPINAVNGNKIRVIQQRKGNKRKQICHAIPYVKTEIMIGVDATVFWPSNQFLPAILAPFEDLGVGVVGTYKRVVREPTGFNSKSFWNFIGCLYLERHNFEVTATSNVDGGVFVISGRTAAYRTEIFADPAFQRGFMNERLFFNLFGPLNPDDDNFITRWVIRHGWKVKFQYSEDAMIQTRVGTYPKYLSQCLRWVRTTWRSNSASLFTDPFRTNFANWVYVQQPWCVYAVHLTSFFNFALFVDLGLLYAVSKTTFVNTYGLSFVLLCMLAWIFASKLVKPFSHFRRNPADLLFLPGYILFGYYHSFIKLYALFTFWNCEWSGRKVEDAKIDKIADDSDDCDDEDAYYSEYFPSPIDSPMADDEFNFPGRSPRNASVTYWNVGARHRETAPAPDVVQTPWGPVKKSSPQLTPANVLKPQIPGFIGKLRGGRAAPSKPVTSKPDTNASKFRAPPKLYFWVRESNCQRLHSDEYNLMPVLGTPSGYSGTLRSRR